MTQASSDVSDHSGSHVDEPAYAGATVNDYTALLSDSYWNAGVINRSSIVTYSFGSRAESHLSERYSPSALSSWQAVDGAQEAEVRNAIAQVEAQTGLVFYEVAEGGDMTFQMMNFALIPANAAGFAFYPTVAGAGSTFYTSKFSGDVFFDAQNYGTGQSVLDVALHEIGHAVGLKHPHEGTPTLTSELDTSSQTIMSYNGSLQAGYGTLDIQALQAIYGVAANKGAHLSSYGFDAATQTVQQVGTGIGDQIIGTDARDHIVGGAGNDTLFSSAGDDVLFAGIGDDRVEAWDGNDVIFGAAGNDTAYGGAGNDTLYMGSGNDSVVEYSSDASSDVIGAGSGNDTVFAGGGADTIFGGISSAAEASSDYVSAGDGDDLVFGGRGVAAFEADQLFGGTGNDTFYSGVGADRVSGDEGNDLIYGGAGNDTIFAGSGADIVWGGAGNDYIALEAGADIVGFTAGSGNDWIADFNPAEDRIWLIGTTRPFASFADVQAALSGVGNAVIDLGGGANLTLSGVAPGALSADDFIF